MMFRLVEMIRAGVRFTFLTEREIFSFYKWGFELSVLTKFFPIIHGRRVNKKKSYGHKYSKIRMCQCKLYQYMYYVCMYYINKVI